MYMYTSMTNIARRLQETIGEIVNCATKELAIEKGVKEVEETWGQQKFSVNKYMKGTQERGFILGAVDEVLQILDDNAMQLQGTRVTHPVIIIDIQCICTWRCT